MHERLAPFARADAPAVRIAQAGGERLYEQIADELRIERPVVLHAGIVIARHRTVGIVVGIEDEDGVHAIESLFRRPVESRNVGDTLAVQRMVHHHHIEQNRRERVQVRLDAGCCLAAHEFRRSKAQQPGRAGRTFRHNVVRVNEKHIARIGIEEEVARRQIAVTQALQMQRGEAIHDPQKRRRQRVEGWLHPLLDQVFDGF